MSGYTVLNRYRMNSRKIIKRQITISYYKLGTFFKNTSVFCEDKCNLSHEK